MSFSPIYSKKSVFKRNIFQSVLSKCQAKSQIDPYTQELKNLDIKCVWICIVARTSESEYSYEEEEGASNKLLSLLKRMAISNVIIGIRMWPDGSLPQHDIFRMMTNCSKDLLIELVTPPESNLKDEPTTRRPHLIELESLNHDARRNVSVDSLSKNFTVRVPLARTKDRVAKILDKIQESDIKVLRDLGNHAVVGKLLMVLMCLLQKSKPTNSLTRQFFIQNNIKSLMTNLDPSLLTKLQLSRASSLFKNIQDYPSSYFEKISKPTLLLFEYIKSILNSDSSLISLPSIQKSLLTTKGEYLKSKQVRPP